MSNQKQKKIKVTKKDGSEHIVPAANKKFYKSQNEKLKNLKDFKTNRELKIEEYKEPVEKEPAK